MKATPTLIIAADGRVSAHDNAVQDLIAEIKILAVDCRPLVRRSVSEDIDDMARLINWHAQEVDARRDVFLSMTRSLRGWWQSFQSELAVDKMAVIESETARAAHVNLHKRYENLQLTMAPLVDQLNEASRAIMRINITLALANEILETRLQQLHCVAA